MKCSNFSVPSRATIEYRGYATADESNMAGGVETFSVDDAMSSDEVGEGAALALSAGVSVVAVASSLLVVDSCGSS